MNVPVEVRVLRDDWDVPMYETDGAVGLDLRAAIKDPVTIYPGFPDRVSTGIAVAIPEGWEGQVRSRSGLAAKHGVYVLNAPGTIDQDYRGEIQVILTTTENPYTVNPGERIAQLVFCPVGRVTWKIVSQLSETQRGSGGFGSTGVA